MGKRRFSDGTIVTFSTKTALYNFVYGYGTVVGYRDGKYLVLAGFPCIGPERFFSHITQYNVILKVATRGLGTMPFTTMMDEIYYRKVPRGQSGYSFFNILAPSPKTRLSYFLSYFKSDLNPKVETVEIGV